MDARSFLIRGDCLQLLLLVVISMAILRVSTAPASPKDVVGKGETVVRHKDLDSKTAAVANTEYASSPSSSSSSSSSSSEPAVPAKKSLHTSKSQPVPLNPVPVNPIPVYPVPVNSVPANPVRGPIQRTRVASSSVREESKAAAPADRRTGGDENSFLEEEEEEKVPAAATALEASLGDGYQPWQYLLTDPRIQDIVATSSQDQQQGFDSYPSADSESLYSRALTDYLVRTGEIDRTLEDLVAAGVMTSEEAALYREAINLEYGSLPQSPGDEQVVSDPGVMYDDVEPSDVLYDGSNYLQPLPVHYPVPAAAADYFNLASQPLQQEEDEETASLVQPDDDYGQSSRFKDDDEQAEQTNELLRDLLGSLALQEDSDGRSYMSLPAENEVQKPSSSSGSSQSRSAETQTDERGTAIEKELEALPTTGARVKPAGTLEEQQLEEMGNRVRPGKTKQGNRTKPTKNNR